MVSKNQIKLINSLQQKKYRKIEGLFIAEGKKVIQELLNANFELNILYVSRPNIFSGVEGVLVSDEDLRKISALTTANDCLAVFKMPNIKPVSNNGLIVALDDIRDPGNLGTIIRLCDWFGIKELVCSNETVDVYNPKVIQATMGSIARVNVTYCDLLNFIQKSDLPIYGTFMEGENIYTSELLHNGIIVFGNEANGISSQIENLVTNKISIPRFGDFQQTESLNVATATAVILSEFKRQEKY